MGRKCQRIKNTSCFWIRSCHVPRTAGLYLEEQLPAVSWAPLTSWCAKGSPFSSSPASPHPRQTGLCRQGLGEQLPPGASSSPCFHRLARSLAWCKCKLLLLRFRAALVLGCLSRGIEGTPVIGERSQCDWRMVIHCSSGWVGGAPRSMVSCLLFEDT